MGLPGPTGHLEEQLEASWGPAGCLNGTKHLPSGTQNVSEVLTWDLGLGCWHQLLILHRDRPAASSAINGPVLTGVREDRRCYNPSSAAQELKYTEMK